MGWNDREDFVNPGGRSRGRGGGGNRARAKINEALNDLNSLERKNDRYLDDPHNETGNYLEAEQEEAAANFMPRDMHYKYQDFFSKVDEIKEEVSQDMGSKFEELKEKVKADIKIFEGRKWIDDRHYHEELGKKIEENKLYFQELVHLQEIAHRNQMIKQLKRRSGKDIAKEELLKRIKYHEERIKYHKKIIIELKKLIKRL